MGNKNMLKLTLDILMTLLLIMLYNSHIITVGFHEISGLILMVLFTIHCLLNRKWITSITPKWLKKGLAPHIRIGYLVDALLLISFLMVTISGIKVSQVLFPALAAPKDSSWRWIHHFSAALALIFTGIHLGLHWGFISSMVKRGINIPAPIVRPICMVLLTLMLAFGVHGMATGTFGAWLVAPFRIAEASHAHPIEHKPESHAEHAPKSGQHKPEQHSGQKTTVISLPVIAHSMATYLSIMSVFAAIAHWLSKRCNI